MTDKTKQEELVLEEIVSFCDFKKHDGHPNKCYWCGEPEWEEIHTLRPAVKQLINQQILAALAEVKNLSVSAIDEVERKYRNE